MSLLQLTSDLISIENAPTFPRLTFRSFRGESDYPAIAAVQSASEAADSIEEVITVEQVANEFAHPENCDPYQDTLLAEANDQTVGFARMFWRINDAGERIFWQFGYVSPGWRRKGIGRALLQFTEGRARAHAQTSPFAGPNYLRGVGEGLAHSKIALFENAGYQIERYFFFMGRKALHDRPNAPLPAGFEYRPAQLADLRAIWNAKEEAFRDHWGYSQKSETVYQNWVNDPRHDLSQWLVAWDTEQNEIAGLSINGINEDDNKQFRFKRGWVYTLGVRRPYRGRGLARAMLVRGFENFREHGMTEVVLAVDAENPTGALGLYESVGFEVLDRDRLYRKKL